MVITLGRVFFLASTCSPRYFVFILAHIMSDSISSPHPPTARTKGFPHSGLAAGWNQLMAVEPFMPGEYQKYNNNFGWVSYVGRGATNSIPPKNNNTTTQTPTRVFTPSGLLNYFASYHASCRMGEHPTGCIAPAQPNRVSLFLHHFS